MPFACRSKRKESSAQLKLCFRGGPSKRHAKRFVSEREEKEVGKLSSPGHVEFNRQVLAHHLSCLFLSLSSI